MRSEIHCGKSTFAIEGWGRPRNALRATDAILEKFQVMTPSPLHRQCARQSNHPTTVVHLGRRGTSGMLPYTCAGLP